MSPVDAEDGLVPGQSIGPYKVTRILGRGGMGTVYLAESPEGRPVAVKVINRELAGKAEFRERFRREVTAARRIRPFCTAPVLDAALDDELYVVTEYIQGSTLERIVSANGPLQGSDLEGLAVGMATALASIHGAGVVHRDLKPSNILLSPYGPRVIDFGIARRPGTDEGITKTGEMVGTPSYLAPEGLLGQPITAAADVFSWGCVVAYAGTGRILFHGENVGEILYRIVHENPQLDGLEPRLRKLVVRATAKDPLARPSAARLLEELTGHDDPGVAAQQLVSGPTVPDRPPPPDRDGRTTRLLGRRGNGRRNRWVLPTAVAMAAVLAGALAVWATGGQKDGPPSTKANLVNEKFSATSNSWPAPVDGIGYDTALRYGAYFVNVAYPKAFHSQSAPTPSRQPGVLVRAIVQVRSQNNSDEAGVFCQGDSASEYEILVNRLGYVRIRKSHGGTPSELAKTATPVAPPGKPTRISASCESRTEQQVRIRVWVDDRKVAEATQTEDVLTGDKIGIVAGREAHGVGEFDTEASFDDFTAGRL